MAPQRRMARAPGRGRFRPRGEINANRPKSAGQQRPIVSPPAASAREEPNRIARNGSLETKWITRDQDREGKKSEARSNVEVVEGVLESR